MFRKEWVKIFIVFSLCIGDILTNFNIEECIFVGCGVV
jgi:hypothetical protein